MYSNSTTFLGLINQVLNFFNFRAAEYCFLMNQFLIKEARIPIKRGCKDCPVPKQSVFINSLLRAREKMQIYTPQRMSRRTVWSLKLYKMLLKNQCTPF